MIERVPLHADTSLQGSQWRIAIHNIDLLEARKGRAEQTSEPSSKKLTKVKKIWIGATPEDNVALEWLLHRAEKSGRSRGISVR